MAEGVSAFVTPAFTDGKGNIIWSDLFGEYSLPINNPVTSYSSKHDGYYDTGEGKAGLAMETNRCG